MRIILHHDLEMLKVLVLHKADIQVLIPSIIKDLSASIFSLTKKRLSDTTLKRIFGFADTQHQPSLYTVNVLAEYCGYSSYQEFCEKQVKPKRETQAASADDPAAYYNKARLISEHTLQALKNKSGIPFHHTISREFLEEHLEILDQSAYPATVIAAPAGYGKTIALCHWVESQLNLNCANGGCDMLLFLSGKVLNRVSFQSQLFDWLTEIIGITDDGLTDELDKTLKSHKFYLVIDAFDLTSLEQSQWNVLFDLLMDTIVCQKDNPNFKVILTMRSSTWMECKRQLQSNGQLDYWYEGFCSNEDSLINIPLLNAYELKYLCHQINPKTSDKLLSLEAMNLFSYPLFLQYYYQKHKDRFSLEKLDTYHTFDIIHQYIYEKVYTGQHSTEKMLLIHSIIDHAALNNCRLNVDKLRMYDEITMFKDAFKDLKSIGILREINNSDEQGFAEQIEFGHEHLQTYFMASKIIYNHDRIFDEKLIRSINQLPDQYFKLKVLKWCIFTALKTGQHFMFENLPNVDLEGNEKCKLIKFLGNLIEEGYIQHSPSLNETFFDLAYPKLFDYFFAIELYGPDLEWVLKLLAKQPLSDRGQIAVATCLAIQDLLKLDSETLEVRLTELKSAGFENTRHFVVNPIKCIETTYYYLRFEIIKTEALEEITRFYFNPDLKEHFYTAPGINTVINILALHTLQVTGNLKKQLRFVEFLLAMHEKQSVINQAYQTILMINRVQLLRAMGLKEESRKHFDALQVRQSVSNMQLTPYVQCRLDYLTTQMAVDDGNYPKLSVITDKYLGVKKQGFPIIDVNILALLLMSWHKGKDGFEYKALQLQFMKATQLTRFSPQAFLNHFSALNPRRLANIHELIYRK